MFSIQQLLDCVPDNMGCHGGFVFNAYNYVRSNGIYTELIYPYVGKNEECRHVSPDAPVLNVFDVCHIKEQDTKCLMGVIEKKGPISIAMYADCETFPFYAGGIYSCALDTQHHPVNHEMTVVGYFMGPTIEESYYIVQNSHGYDWGVDGYMYLTMNKDYDCGASSDATYPVITDSSCHPDY